MYRSLFKCSITLAMVAMSALPVSSTSAASTLATTDTDVLHAYTLMGINGQAIARAITRGDTCPTLIVDSKRLAMHERAAKGTPAARNGDQPDAKPAAFPVTSCEADIPVRAHHASVGDIAIPVPVAEPRHIVVIGDTGCRAKASENYYQSCNDSDKWPFAKISALAASHKPDLVIHVGDYHYRESPCPADNAGCTGSPWGYGYDVWDADVFQPAAPLWKAAPWVAVRGNHESCNRAGQGWFRFLDVHSYAADSNCDDPKQDAQGDFTVPYAVPLDAHRQLIVFDSSKASANAYTEDSAAFKRYRELLIQVDQLAAKPGMKSIFLSHHPILGLAATDDGKINPGNQGLQSVMTTLHGQRLFADGIDLAMHGHVHQFQALGFSSNQPATLVGGNSGSDLSAALPAQLPPGTEPAPGAVVETFFTQHDFGFMTMDRTRYGWYITEWSRHGKALFHCRFDGKLACTRTADAPAN
ncbi:MAG TPA: metallophosphoesterase [Rhodocyclaceae bacterium]|nr:metallophosphoesterase [Rhodocyclaceae bacterium]